MGSSHYIGRCMDAMKEETWDDFDNYIFEWIIVIAVGSLFSGIRDWVYGISSEKIGMDVRSRFYEAIIKKDTGFFDDKKTGDIRKFKHLLLFIFIFERIQCSNSFFL